MEAAKTIKERFTEARRLEQAGESERSAALYQKIVDSDPDHQQAVARLLVIYRKLKEYRKELAVIDAVLASFAQRDKDLQAKWIKEHPKAAGASRSMVRQLGGARVSAFGVNPVVSALQKRKEIVVRRLGGRKEKAATPRRETAASKSEAATSKSDAATSKRDAATSKREAATEARRAAADKQPSLFVISLRYLVSLDKIDAAMPSHVAFLKKHSDKGDFIVSGRQVPRSGGIIIARGKNLDAVERLMKNDPFVKKKLASVDIVEFKAGQINRRFYRGTLF
jgi:uncharacterized protein YciI